MICFASNLPPSDVFPMLFYCFPLHQVANGQVKVLVIHLRATILFVTTRQRGPCSQPSAPIAIPTQWDPLILFPLSYPFMGNRGPISNIHKWESLFQCLSPYQYKPWSCVYLPTNGKPLSYFQHPTNGNPWSYIQHHIDGNP